MSLVGILGLVSFAPASNFIDDIRLVPFTPALVAVAPLKPGEATKRTAASVLRGVVKSANEGNRKQLVRWYLGVRPGIDPIPYGLAAPEWRVVGRVVAAWTQSVMEPTQFDQFSDCFALNSADTAFKDPYAQLLAMDSLIKLGNWTDARRYALQLDSKASSDAILLGSYAHLVEMRSHSSVRVPAQPRLAKSLLLKLEQKAYSNENVYYLLGQATFSIGETAAAKRYWGQYLKVGTNADRLAATRKQLQSMR